MPAAEEVKRAAARLRRAAAIKRRELEAIERELGTMKDGHQRKVLELGQEIADLERRAAAPEAAPDVLGRLQAARRELQQCQQDAPRLIAEKEQAIRAARNDYQDLIQQAGQLETQAGQL